ncbi:transcriptional protein SWT1 [Thunnus albacares]|uniref:transcriptional protein SWT1 n=1 Tax=Thunnus albacares TaxID=8236 RepID=UPI001CF618DF|nr:transcriptional protein SWT1 [Thunnus albacares]XP_044218488.1 transcriptional protein SWT1 [Thunnus albacares]
MSKKSKKRKRKKWSSSSSEEDEKAPKERDVTKKYKSSKRKQDVKSQESSATKPKDCASLTVKEDSQSSRQIKKAVYRLPKTQATDQKPVNKGGECSKTKYVSVPFHGDNCSSKAKPDISGKNIIVSGSKTVQRRPSKSPNIYNAGAVPQREEWTSRGSSNEKSSHRSPSRLKKQLMSPSSVSTEQKEQRQNVLKKKCKTEEPPRTGNDSDTVKTREPSKTSSVSLDSQRQKRKELVKKMHQRLQENDLNDKRSVYTEAKMPSATTREQSSTSAKYTTSERSSNVLKNVTSIPGNVTSVSHKTASSSCTLASPPRLSFKILKKAPLWSVHSSSSDAVSTNRHVRRGTELSKSGASVNNSKQETVKQAHSRSDVTPIFPCERKDKRSSWSGQLPATCNTDTVPWYDQMQLVEELHLARSEKRLEVDVMQSYGELTCMDIDPPEEGATDTLCKQPLQQGLILVLDTNVLLSHLDYVKKMRSHGLGALGFPVVLIPWVVLQELDSLKKGRGLTGSVAHLACPAISYIYDSLKSRDPYLWGQSMQQAAQSSNGLSTENNDDRVLQCCLQYQTLYPECALILCTNDKNLCSKALLSGVKAHSKNDLEAEGGRSGHGPHLPQNNQIPMLPHISPQVSSPVMSRSFTPVQQHSQERTGLSVGAIQNDRKQLSEGDEEKKKWDLSRSVSELEDCLQEVLSEVLEVEMKAAYEDLWQEIVYLKPPWTLKDILQCLKKHWIAVFGFIVPREKLQTVLNLINFFNSGKSVDCSAMLAALQEAKDLVKAFEKSSSHVPRALSVMDNIFHNLQPQGESPTCDVVMNDDDEDKQLTSAQVSHQEVWALFENIWSNVCRISFEVFKALGFDPHTMQSAQPAGGPPPPQDAVACLQKLSSMVSQLLQAFSSVLSSAPGLEEVQTLLSIIQSNKIVDVDSRLAAKDLLDCFSQQDYREKLRVGGTQLMGLKEALDRCAETTGQHITFNT